MVPGPSGEMEHQLFEFERCMPPWLRPACRGALFFVGLWIGTGWSGLLFGLALLATLVVLAGLAPGLALFAGLLGVSLGAGAVAGAVLGMLHPLERLGRLGAWLRWTAAIAGFVSAFTLLTPHGPFVFGDPTLHPVLAGVSAFSAGLLVLLDDRGLKRPSARKFLRLEGRKRLWEAAARARARLQPGGVLRGREA